MAEIRRGRYSITRKISDSFSCQDLRTLRRRHAGSTCMEQVSYHFPVIRLIRLVAQLVTSASRREKRFPYFQGVTQHEFARGCYCSQSRPPEDSFPIGEENFSTESTDQFRALDFCCSQHQMSHTRLIDARYWRQRFDIWMPRIFFFRSGTGRHAERPCLFSRRTKHTERMPLATILIQTFEITNLS